MKALGALGRRLLRPTAFRLGVLAGLGVFACLGLLIYLLFFWPNPEPDFNIQVISRGADLDRHGARNVTVGNDSAGLFFRSTCKEGCDDLWYRTRSSDEETYTAQVLDAAGACIACGTAGYVTRGPFGGLYRWTFASDLRRAGEPRWYHLERDGTLRPAS